MQTGSQASPNSAPMPDASGRSGDAGADLQEATSPVAAARQQQNGAGPATPAERPKRAAAVGKSLAQRATPHRRCASSAAANGVQNGAAAAANGAAGNTVAVDGAAPPSTAAGVGGRGSRGAATDAAEQQGPQPVPEVAWGVADSEPSADARDLVLQRLLRHRSAAAHAMPIRPQLQVTRPVLATHTAVLCRGRFDGLMSLHM